MVGYGPTEFHSLHDKPEKNYPVYAIALDFALVRLLVDDNTCTNMKNHLAYHKVMYK